jgi:anaerobic ribonucleoside-triphosphate reductase activating protein
MNYAAIKPYDIANGPGVRVSLFVSGCTHHCPGCFNPETWDFDYGEKYNGRESLFHILDLLKPDYINGLTILGGEPLEPQNMVEVFILIDMVRRVFSGKKTIWLYTGWTLEELRLRTGSDGHGTQAILDRLDVLVDGPFIETQKNISLQFRGSENQRIIDMPKTRKAGKIVLWEGSK